MFYRSIRCGCRCTASKVWSSRHRCGIDIHRRNAVAVAAGTSQDSFPVRTSPGPGGAQGKEIKGRDSELLLAAIRPGPAKPCARAWRGLTAVVETAGDGFILIDARGRIRRSTRPANGCSRLSRRRGIPRKRQDADAARPTISITTATSGELPADRRTQDHRIGREGHGLRKDGSTFPMDFVCRRGQARRASRSLSESFTN